MGYIGATPSNNFITTDSQRVTSSTNNYVDLDNSISSLNDVIVWVNSVKQDSTNLTLTTSTRITLGDTLTASDVVEIAYLGKAVATQTPDNNTITNDMLVGSIANSKLANSSISINGSSVSLGGSLTGIGGDNTPAFHAVKSGAQSVNNSTSTLVTFETEQLDSDGKFASSRFTPTVAGHYFIYGSIVVDQLADGKANYAQIKKNGSLLLTSQINTGTQSSVTSYVAGRVELGASDYVELFSLHNHGSAQNVASGTNPGSFFGGFKLII